MKNLTKAILAGIVALSFTACGGGGGSDAGATPPSNGGSEEKLISIQLSEQYTEPGFGVGEEKQFYVYADYTKESECSGPGSCPAPPPSVPVDVTEQATWRSLDVSVATVAKGLVKGISEGETIVEVMYGGLSAEIYVNVGRAHVNKLIITPSEKTINVGQSFTFSVKGLQTDGVEVPVNASWNTSNDAIAEMEYGSPGTFTGVAPGQVRITARWYGDTNDYGTGEATLIVR